MTVASRLRFAAAAVALAAAAVAVHSQKPVTIIAYGDTRFTDPNNVTATNPRARAALIARIADEHPDAILVSGDLPWHGGVTDDYAQFRAETTVWRSQSLRVLPALGNHEFSQCEAAACLENWWKTFPELRGRRWYAASEVGRAAWRESVGVG